MNIYLTGAKNCLTALPGFRAKSLLSVLLFTIFSPIGSWAKTPFALYQYAGSAGGRCMAPPSSSPKSVLSRNGISYRGSPSSDEITSLAKGLEQIERLRGGSPLPKSWRTPYNYVRTNGKSTWNQASYAINVRRPSGSSKGENVTRLMHELGHKVGNAGSYDDYRDYVGRNKCGITTYAKKKTNEEFAEVFAAFVTWPDKLKETCPRSFRFFSQRLFPKSESKTATCDGAGELVRETLAGNMPNQDWEEPIKVPKKIKKVKKKQRINADYHYYDHHDDHYYEPYYGGFR